MMCELLLVHSVLLQRGNHVFDERVLGGGGEKSLYKKGKNFKDKNDIGGLGTSVRLL